MQRGGVWSEARGAIAAAMGARRALVAALIGATLAAGIWAWTAGRDRAAAAGALTAALEDAEARLVAAFARLDEALARLAAGTAAGPDGGLARHLHLVDKGPATTPEAAARAPFAIPPPLLDAALASRTEALLGPFRDPLTGEALMVRALALGAGPERRVALAEVPKTAIAAALGPGPAAPVHLRAETPAGLLVAAVPPGAPARDGPSLRQPLDPAGVVLVATWTAPASSPVWSLLGTVTLGALAFAAAVILAGRIAATPGVRDATIRPVAPAAPGDRPLAVRSQRLHVLAVDDSPANLSVLRALLSTTGVRLETRPDAAAGLEALSAAAAAGQPFDVVLMDVMMPGIDGIEATRRIRALPGQPGRVPVIAVTASAFPEGVAACLAAGMNAHVAKPVNCKALLRAIAAAVAGEAGAEDLAALRPSFLAELAARLAEVERGGAATAETVHAIAGALGHLGAADLVEEARLALRALRERSPEASACVARFAHRVAERFPDLRVRADQPA